MKTSLTWRLWLMITGALLGLLAAIGVAPPASASTAASQGWGDADLTLRIFDDGGYRVRGEGYEAHRVQIWIINESQNRVVDEFSVRTDDDGDFVIRDDGLRCDRTYRAVSYSGNDDWNVSSAVRFDCD